MEYPDNLIKNTNKNATKKSINTLQKPIKKHLANPIQNPTKPD